MAWRRHLSHRRGHTPRELYFDEARGRVVAARPERVRGGVRAWFDGGTIHLAGLLAAFASLVTWVALDLVERPAAPAFASLAQMPGAAPPASRLFRCTVKRVHDGDGPIHCREGMKIRLTAIAARELDETCRPGHPCPAASGAAAAAALRRLADGRMLTCEASGSSDGRINAWCWREEGIELNCAMAQSSMAAYWQRYDPRGRLCRQDAPA